MRLNLNMTELASIDEFVNYGPPTNCSRPNLHYRRDVHEIPAQNSSRELSKTIEKRIIRQDYLNKAKKR